MILSVLPFLCSDDSEADSESEPAEQRPESHESLTDHDTMVLRWRDRVASRLSSPPRSSPYDTLAPSSEFPLAPFAAPLRILRPFPARRLAWRRISHHSSDLHSWPDFTSDSSSSCSSLDSSSDISSSSSLDSLSDSSLVHSLRCYASGQSHSGPSTRVASPRLVYPPVMTLRCSEAFMRWGSAPLSTPYPPMTSESSLDSSSERSLDSSSPSARPSRKRCRSPTILVSPSTPIPRLRAGEEHIEIGTADTEAVADLCIGDAVGAPTEDGIGMGVEVATSDIRE
ncbi:hypothetical protein Tco_0069435, partial [Tanacetum coccineum]